MQMNLIKMKENFEYRIPLSKTKLILLFIGSLTFVFIGTLFILNPEKYISIVAPRKEFIFFGGLAAVLFFGICAIFFVLKLFDSKPGIVINSKGFLDNSSTVSAGFVKWDDIERLSIMKVRKTKLILIHVKNPNDYINRQTNWFKKNLMKYNFNNYETPLSLTSNGLKCQFDELLNLIKKGIEN
jgi:hypothetical protein